MKYLPKSLVFAVLVAGAMAPALATEDPGVHLDLQGGISQARHHSLKSFNAPRHRTADARPDSDIERDIATILKADARIEGSIHVVSIRGVVVLTGLVEDTGMYYRVIELVEKIDGVVGTNEDGLDVI
jgi:hypothetical protein